MKFTFKKVGRTQNIPSIQWQDWKWQLKNMKNPFKYKADTLFSSGVTPYYLRLIKFFSVLQPIVQPSPAETLKGGQSLLDPLGEKKHSPFPRLIHRYPDRVLLLVTDTCAVYCRYCTRKRFTGKKQAFISQTEFKHILDYIKKNKGIREVILSGGDPLSLSDSILKKILQSLRAIENVEIIRIASRMPVVCPMRLTDSLINILKAYQPIFLMTHFNHPLELTQEVQTALTKTANAGILMFNQTVLLKNLNNHPSIIQALMRRLLYLRVKPYYMFQCDPSEGSDHFRTSLENSQWIQRELWGRFSGLALPNLSVDIPKGGGKVGLVPDFIVEKEKKQWRFKGWDDLEESYFNPEDKDMEVFWNNQKSDTSSVDSHSSENSYTNKQINKKNLPIRESNLQNKKGLTEKANQKNKSEIIKEENNQKNKTKFTTEQKILQGYQEEWLTLKNQSYGKKASQQKVQTLNK